MNTPKAQNTASLPGQRASKVHAAQPGAVNKGGKDAKNAEAGAQTPSSPVKREAAGARNPKGPFKIMTIPQAWYDSLHAAPTAAGGAGKERG
jgi:hypothetical protein